jgi:hypothetical protein
VNGVLYTGHEIQEENMKKFLSSFVLILLFTGLAAAQESDEERLDTLIDSAWDKKAQYQEENKKDQKEKKKQQEVTETKTITTITVTTQVTTVQEDPIPFQPHHSRIGLGTLGLAEFLGAITPGLGMAHFTVGDTRGGLITLGMTGMAAVVYLSAEILIETRTIDDPLIYGVMRYGSLGLYGAAVIYDLVGAPIYVMNHNRQLTTQVNTLKPYAAQNISGKVDLGINMIEFELSF